VITDPGGIAPAGGAGGACGQGLPSGEKGFSRGAQADFSAREESWKIGPKGKTRGGAGQGGEGKKLLLRRAMRRPGAENQGGDTGQGLRGMWGGGEGWRPRPHMELDIRIPSPSS